MIWYATSTFLMLGYVRKLEFHNVALPFHQKFWHLRTNIRNDDVLIHIIIFYVHICRKWVIYLAHQQIFLTSKCIKKIHVSLPCHHISNIYGRQKWRQEFLTFMDVRDKLFLMDFWHFLTLKINVFIVVSSGQVASLSIQRNQ